MIRRFKAFALITLWMIIGAAPVAAEQKLTVSVTNYPLSYFTERLAGELLELNFPAGRGGAGDPAFWKPTLGQIVQMQQSDLIIINGASYEKWLAAVSLPRSRILDTSAGFKESLIYEQEQATHRHGPAGEHSHRGLAFTTWLDFELAVLQVNAIAKRLSVKLPGHKQAIARNLEALTADLGALHQQMEQLARKVGDQPLLVSHPVYQYLAKRYGLNIHSVHWEPEVMPPDSEWGALSKLLNTHAATSMLWEDKPIEETAKQLAAIGVRSIVFKPAGNGEANTDFLAVMSANIENLRKALS